MHYWSITGLFIDILGAWMVAYEILWGYSKRVQRDRAQIKLDQLKGFIELHRPSRNIRPQKLYTDEELAAEAKQFDETWMPSVKNLADDIDRYDVRHPEHSFFMAVWGIIFLTIGFSLQIVGALAQ